MNADEYTLKLPSIAINNRENLPQKSGIYYVVDEKSVIWYIGQAKNLRTRWVGDSHHRIYQLQKQRKKQFSIYYELVNESMLNAIEKQRIEYYNPQLNGTRVSSKKIHPTETLLRETLITIAPYSFILGIEPPRKEDTKLIEYSLNWRDNWRVNKSVILLNVIHICINLTELAELANNGASAIRFLKRVFRKNSKYANNWTIQFKKDDTRLGLFVLRRLLVNGTAIEVYGVRQEVVSLIRDYKITQLAGVDIKTVTDVSLEQIKDKCLLNPIAGLYLRNASDTYLDTDIHIRVIKRLNPYQEDLIKIIFNESIDTDRLIKLPPEVKTTKVINNGLSIRLTNLATKKNYLRNLLIERGVDLDKYQVREYLENIPKDNNHYESNRNKKMIVYVKSFLYSDLRSPIYSSSSIYGKKGITSQTRDISNSLYEDVYLAVTVDRVFWSLLESYLSDFVKVTLNENEGYITQCYISPRKILKPSTLSITLNSKWKSDIPIGPKNNMSYYEVTEVIKNRLQNSGIPKLNLKFQMV